MPDEVSLFDSDPPESDAFDSDPPEESTINGALVSRAEWRYERRVAKIWRQTLDKRLRRLERRILIMGLALAALSAGAHDFPWSKVLQALGVP